MSELLQGSLFVSDADGSTSLPAGSPAKTYQQRGEATDYTVTARRSFLNLPELLTKYDQLGSSLRTCLRSAVEALIGYSLNWTDSGTPGGRAWWVLGRSGRRTSGTGCGSLGDGWTTINAQAERDHPTKRYSSTNNASYPDGRKCQPTLMGVLNRLDQWTSPTVRYAESLAKVTRGAGSLARGQQIIPPLAVQASWRTPQVWDGTKENKQIRSSDRQLGLTAQVCAGPPDPASHSTSGKRQGSSGQLNPAWVCQLQGLPDGWLDLPVETVRKLRESSRGNGGRR